MSFQHRSRIKSVADYSDNIAHKGACCYPHAGSASFEYYNTCIANKGIWQPILGDDVSSFSCPDIASIGCCCACSFVDDFRGATGFFNTYNPQSNNCYNYDGGTGGLNYPCYQGGLQDNITWCECNDKGGVWSEGIPCSTWGATGGGEGDIPEYIITGAQSLCTRNGAIEDVRWPGACCAGITCNEACNANDCNNFVNEYNGATGIFYTNKYCSPLPYGIAYPGAGEGDLIVSCDSAGYNFDGGGDEDILERDLRTGIYISKGYTTNINQEAKSRNASKNIRSSCNYISTKDDGNKELKCSNETKISCDEKFGIWSGFDEYSQIISCGDVSALDINDYLSNKKKISSSVVSLWKDGQRVLNLGRYAGTFNVMDGKHGEGVICLGNENTGTSNIYKPKNIKTTDNSDKKFAIIVADRDFKYRSDNTVGWTYETDISKNDVADSSRCDSEYNLSYNRHLSLSKKIDISYNNQSNFLWRPPSKDELAFINLKTNSLDFVTNTTLEDGSPNTPFKPMTQDVSAFYWSSTFITDFKYNDTTQMVYVSSIGSKGVVGMSPVDKRHNVRLIVAFEIV